VDLDALRENLAWIRHRTGPGVAVITVVKADAYSHGLRQIAACLMQSGTDVFGVANLAEARAIRSVGRGWPILMLGACLPKEVELAVWDDVMPTLSTVEEARRFSQAAVRQRKTVGVHIKVDTGMGRLGARPEAALELVGRARRLRGLSVQGLYTHYAAVEDDAIFSRRQRERFRQTVKAVLAEHGPVGLIHANNSGALLLEPESLYNAVRPGLLVYGIVPPGNRRQFSPLRRRLRPALEWKCRVNLVRELPKGTPLSYGATFVTPRRMRVATLTAGYGDGYPRSGSNRGRVLIRGRRCRLLGRVTMDQMLADVSEVRGVWAGDEVVLIGRQQNERISANEVAAWCQTVPWEILTGITARVPRVYLGARAA
jgi:alanine racemase